MTVQEYFKYLRDKNYIIDHESQRVLEHFGAPNERDLTRYRTSLNEKQDNHSRRKDERI